MGLGGRSLVSSLARQSRSSTCSFDNAEINSLFSFSGSYFSSTACDVADLVAYQSHFQPITGAAAPTYAQYGTSAGERKPANLSHATASCTTYCEVHVAAPKLATCSSSSKTGRIRFLRNLDSESRLEVRGELETVGSSLPSSQHYLARLLVVTSLTA